MTDRPGPRARIAAMRSAHYDLLKAHDFDLYRRTIESAGAVILNHRLTGDAAVDVEALAVLCVCGALGLRPPR